MRDRRFVEMVLVVRSAICFALAATSALLAVGAPQCVTPPGGRWHGININTLSVSNGVKAVAGYDERDFALLEEWGFNFTRLTLDYRWWIKDGDWTRIDDEALKEVDRGIAFARKHGLHVMLNFHRAPGHCCCPPYEPVSVFVDTNVLAVCARHWAHFARRYKDIPSRELSFNLFNEPPPWLSDAAYTPTVKAVVAAIRAEDPDRLVVVDGLDIARKVPKGLLNEPKMAFSTRGYGAKPEEVFAEWDPVIAAGKFVFMGEIGASASVPHKDSLVRLEKYFRMLHERNMGWALWEIRGGFGVINSCRPDVDYETFRGEKLDRQMLELLRQYGSRQGAVREAFAE